MAVALSQIQSASLREQAEQAIRTAIISGKITAGKIYSVAYFAGQLGVSATPVREALLNLSNEELVEPVRNRGFRVPQLGEHDLEELFELRALLELPAVRKAAELAQAKDVSECAKYIADMRSCVRRRHLGGYLEADRRFHARLLEPLANRRLVKTVTRLRDQTRLYSLSEQDDLSLLLPSIEEHKVILDAMRRRDGDAAAANMERHLARSRAMVKKR